MNAEIAIVMAVKNQRCQPEAPARKLKAAPVLCTSTRLKNGSTGRTSPYWNAPLIHALVARSTATTATETRSQRAQRASVGLRMRALFSRALEVGHAARADRGVPAVGAHVLAPMPAALALRVRTRRDPDGRERLVRFPADLGPGGDEHELEIVAEGSQQVASRPVRLDRHFGLQRG